MKKSILLFVFISPFFSNAQSGTISENERRYVKSYFTSVKERLKSTLDGIDDSQWTKLRSDGGWSPAQTMEHILIGTTAQLGQVGKVVSGEEVVLDRSSNDGLLLSFMTDRGRAFSTPLPPKSNGAMTKEEMFSQFLELEKKFMMYVNDESLRLRNFHGGTPFKMQADAYQLLVLIGGHIFRHTSQIIETLNET